MLAESIKGFMEYVYRNEKENLYQANPDKLYRVKLLVEEYRLRIISDELIRINKYVYDKKYTSILVNDFRKALQNIGEYIENNEEDLFFFTARLYTLRSIASSFTNIELLD